MQLKLSRTLATVLLSCAVITVAALVFGIVSSARAASFSVLPITSQQTGITVCGHGTAQLQPDQATIQVGVTATAGSAQSARDQAAQAMTAVINAVKKDGVDAKDIQTGYVSIQPTYDYSNGKQQLTGYIATNSVSVLVRKVDATSKVVDDATAAGGNRVFVSGISFSTSDPTAAQMNAQKNAVADAQRQAAQIAQAASVTLSSPVAVQVGGCGTVQSTIYTNAFTQDAKAASGSAPTPIQPGQNTVDVYVAVVYGIK